MKTDRINKAIDSGAESAKETIDLLAGKIDEATQCGKDRMEHVREHMSKAATEVKKAAQAATGKAHKKR